MRFLLLIVLYFILGVASRKGPQKHHKIAIIGAGPSGISTAYFLSQNGYHPKNIRIFEKTNRIGGHPRDYWMGFKSSEIFSLSAYAGTGKYWTTLKVMSDLGVTKCNLFSNVGYNLVDPTTSQLYLPIQFILKYYHTNYNLSFTSPQAFQIQVQQALSKYFVLWSKILNVTLDGQYQTPYLFPRRPSKDNMKYLSQSTFQFLKENNLLVLDYTFRSLLSVQSYGPLEEVPVWYTFSWMHPKVLVSNEIWGPCDGFEQMLINMATPFDVVLNSKIKAVKRNKHKVTLHFKNHQEDFDWVVFTNKFVPGQYEFIDMREDEFRVFRPLVTTHLKTFLIDIPSVSVIDIPTGAITNIDSYINYQNATLINKCGWAPRAKNSSYTSTQMQLLCSLRYAHKHDKKGEGFKVLSQFMSSLHAPGVVLNEDSFEVLATLESQFFFQRYLEKDVSKHWDIWDLQGKYRSWYVGSPAAGFESIGDIMDYAKQLVEILGEKSNQ